MRRRKRRRRTATPISTAQDRFCEAVTFAGRSARKSAASPPSAVCVTTMMLGVDSASLGSVAVPRRSAQVATWPRSPAVEACGGAPRSFHLIVAAGEDLLHSPVDPHAGIMRDVTYRACALGAWWFQSHQAPFSCEVRDTVRAADPGCPQRGEGPRVRAFSVPLTVWGLLGLDELARLVHDDVAAGDLGRVAGARTRASARAASCRRCGSTRRPAPRCRRSRRRS